MAKVGQREAVTLWETSGRTQSEVAGALEITPGMLRRWQRGMGVGPIAQPTVCQSRNHRQVNPENASPSNTLPK
jgi:transposase-like protein